MHRCIVEAPRDMLRSQDGEATRVLSTGNKEALQNTQRLDEQLFTGFVAYMFPVHLNTYPVHA